VEFFIFCVLSALSTSLPILSLQLVAIIYLSNDPELQVLTIAPTMGPQFGQLCNGFRELVSVRLELFATTKGGRTLGNLGSNLEATQVDAAESLAMTTHMPLDP